MLLFICRGCEKTMSILRRSDRVISTILQVLVDDPLLDWTLTAEELEKKQFNQARPAADISAGHSTAGNILYWFYELSVCSCL